MSNPSLANLQALREELCTPELDQAHLFAGWPETMDEYNDEQVALLTELYNFANFYSGGVQQYIRSGKRLLDAEHEDDAMTALEMPPLVYNAPSLYQRTDELAQLEATGVEMAKKTVFVLVAGGLGERLGYPGIKVGLPVETATSRCYLEHYLSWAKQVGGDNVPFVIMTSDDTHTRTQQLIDELKPNMPRLRLLKQEMVFCFQDSAAHLCMEKGKLLRKPHGHGDVHSLIYMAKENGKPLVDAWLEDGYQSIAFFQDTNSTSVNTIPVSLAISKRENLDMNFTCIPRKPKEAIGLLCRLQKTADGPWYTMNVEYNVFEVVSRTLTKEGGDVAAKNSDYSPFPGSINTLLYRLPVYAAKLKESKGTVPEFINPKYADETRRSFKKPARVESLMQDFAQLLSGDYRVGGIVFERFTYQPVKNSLEEANGKVKQGINAYCASTGEEDYYEITRRRLKAIGVPIFYASTPDVDVNEFIKVHLFPIVTLDSVTAGHGTLTDLAKVFPDPAKVHVSEKSTLMIEGRVVIESLRLDGAVRIVGPSDPSEAPLVIRDLEVRNKHWSVRPTTAADKNEVDLIRGFVLEKNDLQVVNSGAKL